MTGSRNKGRLIRNLPEDFTIIDIETTGLSFDYDEIIEYGAIRVRNGRETARFSTLVKPEYGIYDPYVTELTGITNEMLEDAPSLQDATAKLIEFVGNDIISGHRLAFFDINFIYDAVKETANTEFNNDYFDTWCIANRLFGKTLGNLRLETLANHFEVNYAKAHRAVEDCEITLECYRYLKELVLEQYGSEEAYVKTFRKVSAKEKIGNLVADKDAFIDEDSLIYGKEVCITGALEKMVKKDAYQLVLNIGGLINDNGVTKNCSFLVIADSSYQKMAAGEKPSSKMRKAMEYRSKGQDIVILSESAFYEILGVK